MRRGSLAIFSDCQLNPHHVIVDVFYKNVLLSLMKFNEYVKCVRHVHSGLPYSDQSAFLRRKPI